LTVPSGITAQYFFTSSIANGTDWPDVQTFLAPIAPSKFLIDLFGRAFSVKKEVFEEVMGPLDGSDGFILLSMLVRPKSRGQVTLGDKNPFSDPLIGKLFTFHRIGPALIYF